MDKNLKAFYDSQGCHGCEKIDYQKLAEPVDELGDLSEFGKYGEGYIVVKED